MHQEDRKLPAGFVWQGDNVFCAWDQASMAYIPAGVFTMGGDEIFSARPVHPVYLDAYLIDLNLVTNFRFSQFIAAGGYHQQNFWSPQGWLWRTQEGWSEPRYWHDEPWNRPQHPVVGISWFEAEAYCHWAHKQLPTEAQWEKAARGGIWLDGDAAAKCKNDTPNRRYPWGDKDPAHDGIWHALCKDEPTYGSQSTGPVGLFPQGASPYGCLDMAGNVWEWCQDWYHKDYYKTSPINNPEGPAQGEARVLRGGSWCRESRQLQVCFRTKDDPTSGGWDLSGFRCAVKI